MSLVGIVPEPITTLQTWLWVSVLAGCVRIVTANGELLFTCVVKAWVPLDVRTMSLPPLFCRSMDTGVAVAKPLSCTDTVYLVVTQLMATVVTLAFPTVPVFVVAVQTCCVGDDGTAVGCGLVATAPA